MGAALGAILLRLARAPEDWDLRGFMQRLWPEGTAGGQAPREATRVRPVPGMAGPSLDAVAAQGISGGEGKPEEATAATRTGPAPARSVPRRRKTVVLLVLAAVLVVAIGAGAVGLRLRPPGPAAEADKTDKTDARAAAMEGTGRTDPATASGVPESDRSAPGQAAPPAVPAALVTGDAPSPPPDSAAKAAVPGGASRADGAARPCVLRVTATPWAYVTIDGQWRGETPITVALPPGRYRVRAAHPSFGARERIVDLVAGQPTSWHANLRER
jgi:serine/threonine-protein kinase